MTTLRSKIVALYLGLAVLPMVAVGAGSYIQSLNSLTALVETKLQTTSEQAAQAIADSEREIGASLRLLAVSEYTGRILAVASASNGRAVDAAHEPPAYLSSVLRRSFVTVEFRDAAGTVRHILESDSADAVETPCVEPRLVRIRVPVDAGGAAGELVGHTPLAVMLPTAAMGVRFGRTGETLVVDRSTGQVVYDARCETGERSPAAVRRSLGGLVASADATVEFQLDGRRLTGSQASVSDQPLAVLAAVEMEEFTGPYARAQLLYLTFVVLMVLAAGLAFLLLVGNSLGSLGQLSAAAERIGQGELTPWLPPPGRDEVGRLSYAFASMLGRLKETIRQNEQSRQMAVVGQLASQLSHEIRNPLSSIRLNLQSLQREVLRGSVPADLAAVLRVCLREISRLNDAVTSVLEFGRQRSSEKRLCRVERILDESLDLIEPRLRRQNITVVRERGAGNDHVDADAGELRGALLNLFINAIDAMPTGGVLRVRTEPAAREVRIRIADTGPGIPPEVRDRIFEPFFTTKSAGSGIGLPLALQVIRGHDGRLYCERPQDPAAGAEFVVVLPLVDVPATPLPEEESAERMEPGRWRRADRLERISP